MDNTALLLMLFMIGLVSVIVYLLLNPTYIVVPGTRRHHSVMPRPLPQYGPYWAHGGHTSSGLLY